ncbi:hypothetical protein [Mycobacterium sp.]|uniref:hypothetical protein n=1 Tax=Mycobacterium sp. TaxID=1785 RepID=UPI002D3D20DC|nr:hypothetical protein [Mycobacterium sp.]HZA12566.1 hypothetical protein [Mycobacterium sp.]
MLRRDPGPVRAPSRIRLRRRLFLLSAPVGIVALVLAYKLMSVVIAGNAAASDLARHNVDALRGDVAAMGFLNIVEPEKVSFWQANLAAVDGNLAEADSRFADILSHTAASGSCPVRVNLELVRERQGDVAAWDRKLAEAEQRYFAALRVINDAPAGCFQGNNDPDKERRAVRNDAAARLAQKINNLHLPPPPLAPPPAPAPAAPPAPPPAAPPAGVVGPGSPSLTDVGADRLPGSGPVPELRLDPGAGNPLDRLQEALANSDASGQSGP